GRAGEGPRKGEDSRTDHAADGHRGQLESGHLAIGGGHAISFRDGLGATARPGRSGVTGVPARGCFTAGAVWAASGSHLGLVWKSMGRMPTPSAVRLAAALIVKRAPPGPGN